MKLEEWVMAVSNPLIENFFVGALQMRCSVVTDTVSGDTIIIDGGAEPDRLIIVSPLTVSVTTEQRICNAPTKKFSIKGFETAITHSSSFI
jgi:hypothetical protein